MHDLAAGAAGHRFGVAVQRQAAFLLVGAVAGEAMLAEDRPDVLVVGDLWRGAAAGLASWARAIGSDDARPRSEDSQAKITADRNDMIDLELTSVVGTVIEHRD